MSSSDAGSDEPPVGRGEPAEAAAAIWAQARRALEAGEPERFSDRAVQDLMTAALKLFAAKVEKEERFFSPLPAPDAVTPTEVVVTVSEILRAVNLNTFDLNMWFRRRSGS